VAGALNRYQRFSATRSNPYFAPLANLPGEVNVSRLPGIAIFRTFRELASDS
jgi:hypothetical protein